MNLQAAKDEIENLMDKITDDIRHIDIEKGICKEQSLESFSQERGVTESGLAKSTLKGLSEGKKELRFIKSAFNKSMKTMTKKTLSPRVLLRSNTLINYQV